MFNLKIHKHSNFERNCEIFILPQIGQHLSVPHAEIIQANEDIVYQRVMNWIAQWQGLGHYLVSLLDTGDE